MLDRNILHTFNDQLSFNMYVFFCFFKAYERRFPTCPQIPVFVGCEVTLDTESEDGAIRTTERRCKLNVEAPYILKKAHTLILGCDKILI